MSTQYDDDRLLQTIIGTELVADATHDQRRRIINAIQQNPEGVRRLATQIRANPKVRRPIPVLLSKLDSDAHLAASRNETQKLSKLEIAYRLYVAKLADLDKHGVLVANNEKHDAWSEGWTVEDAIAYAIDYSFPGDLELEDALRQRTGLEPYTPAPCPPEARAALRRLAAAAKNTPLAAQPRPAPQGETQILAVVDAVAPLNDDDDIPGYGDAA